MTETQAPKAGRRSTAPDFKSPAVTETRAFWCGAMPSCPYSHVMAGPATFPILTEEVLAAGPGEASDRIPHIGCIMHLSKDDLQRVCNSLSRRVIRFEEPPETEAVVGQKQTDDGQFITQRLPIAGPGAGVQVTKWHKRARRGRIVQIPTEAEMKARKKNRLPVSPYIRAPMDEPLDEHVFMLPAPDPSAEYPTGGRFPDPVSVTGLPNWDDAQPSK